MSNLGNKEIFSKNLNKYIQDSGKSRQELCDVLKIPYSTFTQWAAGIKYPRIDKIELLANYFNIKKSDLIENNKDPDEFHLKSSYFSFAKEMQEKRLSEHDIEILRNVIKAIHEN